MARRFSLRERLRRVRTSPSILQGEAAECGLACLANVAAAHGFETDLTDLRKRFPLSNKGMSLPTILQIAKAMDLSGRALRLDLVALRHIRLPAVLHWNMNHFVVLERVSSFMGRTSYHVIDPAEGRRVLTRESMSAQFTGVALEFQPMADFTAAKLRRKVRLTDLWSRSIGLKRTMVQLVVTAAISQAVYGITPLFMQSAIDSVLPSQDMGLLVVLTLVFLSLAIVGGLSALIRSLASNVLGQQIGFQTSLNLTGHLFALPLKWFEKRQVADIVSRLSSTQPISNFVGQQAFSVAVWGIGLILYGCIVFFYAWQFGLLLVVTLLIYAVFKGILVNMYNERNYEAVLAQTRASGMLIENLEGIAAIKAFGAEPQRQSLWTNARARALVAELRLSRIQSVFDILRPSVNSIEEIVFVLLAVRLVLAGEITVGMTFAAGIYRQQAMFAGSALVDLFASLRQLDVHLDRIRDIVTESPTVSHIIDSTRDLTGGVELRNVTFSYGSGEPNILNAVSLRINAGETIALIGKSGEGKTTLGKIILGLLAPTSGRVLVDGVDLAEVGPETWRSKIGYVAQNDDLFAGSIAENIAFFAPTIDMDQVEWAAKQAVIHDDIERMPMRYETLAGDMGSTFSGGQKARILLARAMYRRPILLLLDEGSAHLDLETEATLNESIKHLNVTRVLIAHRPETIRQADRIIEVGNGGLFERKDLLSSSTNENSTFRLD